MNLSFNASTASTSGDWLPIVIPVWLVIWLITLARVLRRADLDAITRLTWVIVVIFVPFFGILLYWSVAPDAPRRSAPLNDLSGTPWEK